MKSLILLILLTTLLSGCNDGPNETSHPLFIKYRQALNSEKYAVAVEYLKRYLKVRPDSAAGHLAMATLCDEKLDDELGAIYHYQKVLEIEPRSRQSSDVKKWLENAEKRYYLKAKNRFNDPENIVALQNSLYETEKMLKLAQDENRRQAVLVSERRRKIAQLEHELKKSAMDSTDLSILKEQLRERDATISQLEVYRNNLTRSEKEKEVRLQELREAMKTQNLIIKDLRAKLEATRQEHQKELQNLAELRQQLEKMTKTLAQSRAETEELRIENEQLISENLITEEEDNGKITPPSENTTSNQ